MKLNPDCVRDVMLALEGMTGVDFDEKKGTFSFKEVNANSLYMQSPSLKEHYSREEVAYTLIQLSDGGYVSLDWKREGDFLRFKISHILYLTPKGHDFIAAHKQDDGADNERGST